MYLKYTPSPILGISCQRRTPALFVFASLLLLAVTRLSAAQNITTSSGDGGDTYIRGGSNADNNYNSDDRILVASYPSDLFQSRKTYLRFDTSGLIGPAQSAELKLHLRIDNAIRVHVHALNDGATGEGPAGWDEATLTWNNAPGNDTTSDGLNANTTLLGTFDMVDTGDNSSGPYSFSSESLLNLFNNDTNGRITLILRGSESLGGDGDLIVDFWAKEHIPSGGSAGDLAPEFIVNPEPIRIATTTGSGADSYVKGGINANGNFGAETSVGIKGSTTSIDNARKTYLRFDISTVAQSIAAAHLVLETAQDNAVRVNVYGLNDGTTGDGSNGWTESGITWNNAPANATSSVDGVTTDATLLGTFDMVDTVDHSSGPYIFSTEDHAAFSTFLGNDTNGLLTLILTGGPSLGGDGGLAVFFQSKEYVPSGGTAGDEAPLLLLLPRLEATEALKTSDSGGADTYVRGGINSGVNYGSDTTLGIKGGSNMDNARKAYLRFGIPCLAGGASYESATIKLYPSTARANTLYFYGLNDGVSGDGSSAWSETGLTWSNAPANNTSSTNGVTSSATLLGSYVQVDGATEPLAFSSAALLDFLNADTNGSATIIVTADTSNLNWFHTKEAGASLTPTLDVTYVGGTVTCAGGDPGCELPEAPGDTVINLGDKGLQNGDTIDSYLTTWFVDGNEVHIPAGTYRWNGGGVGTKNDCSLIGDGTVIFDTGGGHTWSANFRATTGHLEVRNITVKGKAISGTSTTSKLRAWATSSTGKVVLRNVNQPDGAEPGGRVGWYVPDDHAGEVHFIDCHVEGFPNNGLYASGPGQAGAGWGEVHVLRGLYKNNNIANVRIGTGGSSIREVVSVQDAKAPPYSGTSTNQRGLRVRDAGDGSIQTIDNCDVTQQYTGNGAIVVESHTGSSGVITNTRIRNDISADPISVASGNSWTGDRVDITGTGDLTPSGITITNLCTGSGCEEPTTTQRHICQ